ncbi:MAG: hypothetical protein J5601_02185, partial [Elusimicrobiaceae bacterium]|nr:hypothetical protein [Elusimicrobiaceae bacterium]
RNTERVERQRTAPIRIIIGNPPYSAGQESANDNAQNQEYPHLENRISITYAENTDAMKRALYDTYFKAFRWATDRLPEAGGIICYVSNGAWLDGNAAAGFRKCLEREFSSIYVFNLRGNQRTSGELSRREGGKIFGSGSRTPISITLLVKKPNLPTDNRATILYHDIGDYLTREEKLKIVKDFGTILNPAMNLQTITPNEHGDWLKIRKNVFSSFIPVADKKLKETFFELVSSGFITNRDSWACNFSAEAVERNMRRMIENYNANVEKVIQAIKQGIDPKTVIDNDPHNVKWDQGLLTDLEKLVRHQFDKNSVWEGLYRPFCKNAMYFNKDFNWSRYLLPRIFPTPDSQNLVISIMGAASTKDYSALISNSIVERCFQDKCQNLPRYYYEKIEHDPLDLFDKTEQKYRRRDAITDFIWEHCRGMYGPKVTKDDVFYYVYGILHSEDYRKTFMDDLKLMLPRIPLVESPMDFRAFVRAGRELAALHLNYETQPEPDNVAVKGEDMVGNDYTVQ